VTCTGEKATTGCSSEDFPLESNDDIWWIEGKCHLYAKSDTRGKDECFGVTLLCAKEVEGY
jgi:hypothetical protein